MQLANALKLLYSSLCYRSIINRRMFYSPTKDFVRFSTYRTAEINALRERIQKEKVTPDQITTTQLRLQKLRKQYDGLQKQERSELKDVLQNSEGAIVDLQRQITLSQKELLLKKQQVEELQKVKTKLQECGEEEQQKLRTTVSEKERLITTYLIYQQELLKGETGIDSCSKQLEKQRMIKDDILAAQAEVSKKWQQHRVIQENCQKQKNSLNQKIAVQKAELNRLHKQLQLGEKQVEKCKHLKQNSQISQKFFEEKIQKLKSQKILAYQTQQAEKVQQQMGLRLKQVLQTISNESQRVQKAQQSYQRKIKEVLMRVSEQEQVKQKLEQKVAIAKANLRLFKQKNENLKSKMNAIFKNDSQLIKAISSKKVYPNMRIEVVEMVKKSAYQPLESKQNQLYVGVGEKQPKIENTFQSRLFGQTNRVL